MTDSASPPPSATGAWFALRIVAALFVLSGLLPFAEWIAERLQSPVPFRSSVSLLLVGGAFALLGVAIGVGLLRRRPLWRWIAVGLLALEALLTLYSAAFARRDAIAAGADSIGVDLLGLTIRAPLDRGALLYAIPLLLAIAQLAVLLHPSVARLFRR